LNRKINLPYQRLPFFGTICFILLFAIKLNAQNPLENLSQGADSLKAIEDNYVRKFYVLPIISAAPETSLRLGAVGVLLYRIRGMTPETQLSSIRLPISYTLKNQFRAQLNSTYYSNSNKVIIDATILWINFPLLFYGVGNDTQDADEEIYTTQTLKIDFSILKSLMPKFYIGLGYNYFDSKIVKYQEGGYLEQPDLIPGNTGSIVSGFNLNIRYDNRDNNLCASSGFYADLKIASNEPWMGSDYDFTRLDLDLRKYFQPFSKHVLAVQLVMANIWGDPSFETMALLGGKMIMRGHYEGRFRDNSLYAAQVEYRLPLRRSNWIDERKKVPFKERFGLVGFFGVGDVGSSFGNIDLSKIKTSMGIGIRYLVLPKERINVRLDFGFGTQLPGVYINVREAF
jgi:outer membrane protein assembly factor BamA